AVIVPFDSDLFLNGIRVPITSGNYKFHLTVLESFQARGISGVSIERGVQSGDLEKFFELFLQKDGLQGMAFVQACAAAGFAHVLPATHASITPSGETAGQSSEPAPLEIVATADCVTPNDPQSPWVTRAQGRARVTQALHGARSLLMTTSLQ